MALDLNALRAGMKFDAASSDAGDGKDELATEVISGDLASHFKGFDLNASAPAPPQEDGTVEMKNPLSFLKQHAASLEGRDEGLAEKTMDEGELATEIASAISLGPDTSRLITPSAQRASPATGPQRAVSPAQQPALPPSGEPDPGHQGPWKLKTDFGLTYEFQDKVSLLNWMSGRESLDRYELAAGHGEFFPWALFPQVQSALERTKVPAVGPAALGGALQAPRAPAFPVGAPLGERAAPRPDQAPTLERLEAPAPLIPAPPEASSYNASAPLPSINAITAQNQAIPSSNRSESKWNILLWALFVMLAVGCLALAAQIFGVIDFKALLNLSPEATTTAPGVEAIAPEGAGEPTQIAPRRDELSAAEPQALGAPDAPLTEVSEEDRERAVTLLDAAHLEFKANHLVAARDKVKAALVLDPTLSAAYLLLIEIYERTGQRESAKETQDKLRTLRLSQEDHVKQSEGAAPLLE